MKKYVFKPYSAQYPKIFQQEKARIQAALSVIARIDHIGSTAIPHLGGKGIIDIAIAVNDQDKTKTVQVLESLSYALKMEHSTVDRLYFVRSQADKEGPLQKYHLHLNSFENDEGLAFITFRDYLRMHAPVREAYAQLKQQAALEANEDGAIYRAMKAPIFQEISAQIAKNCAP